MHQPSHIARSSYLANLYNEHSGTRSIPPIVLIRTSVLNPLMLPTSWSKVLAACFQGSSLITTISWRYLLILRVLAVTSFTAYVYSQIHALSLPDAQISKPYGPQDDFVVVFFGGSTLLSVYWLKQLFFKWDYVGDTMPLAFGWDESASDRTIAKTPFLPPGSEFYGLSSAQVTCLPYYILGNIFLTSWSYAWCSGNYLLSQVLLACNLSVQLYAVFMVLHVEHDELVTPFNYATHLVMKTNVGLGVLFMWKNWGVIDIAPPHIAEMVNSGVIFILITVGSGPDPTVGICLLYDLTALLLGHPQSEPWCHAFYWIMIAITATLIVEFHLSEEKLWWLKGFDRVVSDRNCLLPVYQETGTVVRRGFENKSPKPLL